MGDTTAPRGQAQALFADKRRYPQNKEHKAAAPGGDATRGDCNGSFWLIWGHVSVMSRLPSRRAGRCNMHTLWGSMGSGHVSVTKPPSRPCGRKYTTARDRIRCPVTRRPQRIRRRLCRPRSQPRRPQGAAAAPGPRQVGRPSRAGGRAWVCDRGSRSQAGARSRAVRGPWRPPFPSHPTARRYSAIWSGSTPSARAIFRQVAG